MVDYNDPKPLIISKKKPKKQIVPVDIPPLTMVKLPLAKYKLVQQARDSKKMTLKDLAELISKPISTLRDLEKGESVDAGIIKAVEKALNIKLL